MLNRRQFSQSVLASLAATSAPNLIARESNQHGLLASATRDTKGDYWLQILAPADNPNERKQKYALKLPSRAHQVIFHPHKPWVVVVARRPGYYLLMADYETGQTLVQITPQQGFHFYGHAAFSADGKTLFTTENHIASGKGKVVSRHLDGSIQAVFDTHGIGPHQLMLMPDRATLVIANGGIKTHPSQPRKKLNLDTMQPSLAYINASTGKLFEQAFVPAKYHQLSLRHLDVNQQGQVMIGFQFQGEPFEQVPLVAVHQQGHELQFLSAPDSVTQKMKHYVGSVVFDTSGQFAMLSSPKGNLATLWDMQTLTYIDHISCLDGCGVASNKAGGFLISNGAGDIFEYDLLSQQKTRLSLPGLPMQSWDNHMSFVS